MATLSPRRKARNPWVPLAHVVLILGGVTMVLPLLWMISTSLKEPSEVMSYPPEFLPRVQEMWKDPRSGREYPIYNVVTHDRPERVARLATSPGKATVVVLYADGKVGKPEDWRTDGDRKLTPSKHLRPRWQNYPDAWNALKLQRNWLSWDFPYQLNLGFARLGPFHFDGLPMRNAFVA